MDYSWNWSTLLELKPYTEESYLSLMISGLWTTFFLSMTAWMIALFLGLVLGTIHTLPNFWLNRISRAYINFFRNIPLLVQLFVGYFVLPEIIPPPLGIDFKQMAPTIQQLLVAVFILGLFTSARLAEQLRAGLEALSSGQKNAALALGLTLSETYRFILLPMALRAIFPTLTSELTNVIKNSAVCSTIGVIELSYQASNLAECQEICLPYEAFIIITLSYLAINWLCARLMQWLEVRLSIPGYIGNR